MTFGSQGLKFLCHFASISILARLVSPEDFGLIGILASALAILNLLRDLGLTAAIVQSPNISKEQLNGLFRFSILLGLSLLILVTLAGWALSWFLGDPRLLAVAPVYATMFTANALGSVPLGLLRRRLHFGRIAVRDVVSFLFGVVAGIVVAYKGGGYWSLVAMSWMTTFLNTLMAWIAAGWFPSGRAARFSEMSRLLKFGGTFTLSEVATCLSQNLDKLLIGKIWGFEVLGFYTRGYALMLAPVGQIMGPIGSVLIPVLSRLNAQRDRYRQWVLRLFGLFLLGSGPLAAYLMLSARNLVPLILGPGWEMTVDIFFWLSISLFGKPVASLLYWVFVTSGNVREMFRWTTVNMILTVLSIGVGVIWGPVAVAGAYSVTGCLIRTPIAIYYASRTGCVPFAGMAKRYSYGLLWFGSWLGLEWVGDWSIGTLGLSAWAHLAVLGVASALVATLLLFGTAMGRALFSEVRDVLGSIRRPASAST